MGTFSMPSLGADMEAGTLVEWLKKPGDEVKRGDIVAVVETDKGAIEVEIFETGRIEKLLIEEGRKVPVGTPLALIAAGEATPFVEAPAPQQAPVSAEPAPVTKSITVPAPPGPRTGPRASPAARKAAEELHVDLGQVRGTGLDGAIIRQDVINFHPEPAAPVASAVDVSPMRRAIAAAMSRSKREIPHFYLMHSIDVQSAQEAVAEYNSSQPPQERILLGALLLKAVALALRDYPEFNGFYDNGLHSSEAIHVGLAISIRGGGLAAPAIHDADKLTVSDLMKGMRDLTNRVRAGAFRSSEISDPTVTVSSLGDRGVETLFPIIYPPQVAIIGFGTILGRPWVVENRVEIRPILNATLAADHRVTDGHRGALLLQRIGELLQRPGDL